MNSSIVDRRRPPRSEQRRVELLEALAGLLEGGATLEQINVADIADRAAMKRSTFYFYFENKSAAVAALSQRIYEDTATSSASLFEADGHPRERIEAQLRALVSTWEEHSNLYRAMLDAREMAPEVRALFDAGRESFIGPVAAMIDADRSTGIAPEGLDSTAIATVLLELNDRTVDAIARGQQLPVEDRIQVLTSIWLRTIYGTDNP